MTTPRGRASSLPSSYTTIRDTIRHLRPCAPRSCSMSACAEALREGVHSADVVLNILAPSRMQDRARDG